jgi:DNA-binding NarL/FixJ family response regulator
MSNRILIVDDSVAFLHMLRTLFKQHEQFTICGEARSGREAVEKSQECQPDLVVLDFSMPGMNGLETAAKIEQNHPALPMIMLTDFKDPFLKQKAREAGITLVLSKTDLDRVPDFVRILLRPDPGQQEF